MRKILGLIGLMIGVCHTGAMASIRIDEVAAYVNNHVITVSDVMGSSAELQQALRQGKEGPEANALFAEALDQLIGRKLILDAYEQQQEVQIPPMMIDERVQGVIQESFQDDRNAFLRALGEDGRSEESWREEIREQTIVRVMRNMRVDRLVRVSPTDVRSYYEANPESFSQGGSITYRMLVVPATESTATATNDVAAKVQAALDAGEDFEQVTRRYSIDQFAADGGLRGPLDPEQLRAEVREPLKQLAPGQVTQPIRLGSNILWLQLEAFTPAKQIPFSEAYTQVEQILYREQAENLYKNWVARLRKMAFVSVAVDGPF